MNERFIADRLDQFSPGWSIKVRPIRPYANITLGRTALHEAKHLVLLHANGIGAKSGTIEPGPGYLGMVEPNGFDAVAALGPDADGDSGTDHDRRVAAWGSADIGVARSIARSMLSRLREEVRIVAGLLETERTVTGTRVEEVLKKKEDPDEEVEIIEPSGKVVNIKTIRSRRHDIIRGLQPREENYSAEKQKLRTNNDKVRPFVDKMRRLKVA